MVTPVWPGKGRGRQDARLPAPSSGCRGRRRAPRPPARKSPAERRRPARHAAESNTTTAEYLGVVPGPRNTSAPATSSRWCPASASAAPFALPPFSLYRALRRLNPSPFLYYLDFAGFSIVGSSPEILVAARDGKVTIRPIAGTRPRGKTPGRGQGAGRGTAGRSQGTRRASDAGRSRPQRCRAASPRPAR